MSFGSRLRLARKERKLYQHEVALELKVSVQAVSQWERGENYPEMSRVKQLAALFAKPVSYFMADEDFEAGHSVIDNQIIIAPLIKLTEVEWLIFGSSDIEIDLSRSVGTSIAQVGQKFAVEILDESLIPFLYPGDIAIFDNGIDPVFGDYVVAKVSERSAAVIGRYRFGGYSDKYVQVLEVVPVSPEYPPYRFADGGVGEVYAVLVETHSFPRNRRAR